ncbi:MAG: ribosome recycling factor, partial [Clostridia bacterium]|nr:ribosome recycling factor [Clostridia bacterium]
YTKTQEKMQKAINAMENEFKAIRAGRANAAVLDRIVVDYYGTPTPINQMAAISTPEARMLQIQPYDASTLKSIEKAIQASDLGINPQNDGKAIRLSFPALTEERRKELTKQVRDMGEDSKVALRNIRREANDKCKDMKKASEMTEDEQKISEKEVQDLTDKYTKEVDKVSENKKAEIMEI